ncbi:hypothetical protein [Nitrosospira multiformis]|nr:hypothetical protein [Nitrosospira multiformis]
MLQAPRCAGNRSNHPAQVGREGRKTISGMAQDYRTVDPGTSAAP